MSRIGPLEQQLVELRSDIAQLRQTQARLESALGGLQGLLDAQVHNHELLKGEVWDARVQIDSARLADLRATLTGLERRLRRVERMDSSASDSGTAPGLSGAPLAGQEPDRNPAPSVSSTLFDYVGFERRFRGDPDVINAILLDRYGEVLRQHQPVVDDGCGRGELLELLAAEGIEVIGIEPDPGMADEARSRGIKVHQMLAGDYLATVPDRSLGAIISTHVVEHLPLEVLIDFLEGSARKLRPGGVFIAETPNPATLMVLGSHFIMDPTHEWPLHPDLLGFLCESAGFLNVRAEFFAPATTMQLPLGSGDEGSDAALSARVDEAFTRLNHVLFGPQDYAVFATVGDEPSPDAIVEDADPTSTAVSQPVPDPVSEDDARPVS